MDTRTYRERRATLRQAVPGGIIVLPANGEASRNYPAANYPFRQDSHLLYYAGIDRPGPVLVLFADGREILYTPPEDPGDLVWMGPQPTWAEEAAAAGIPAVADLGTLAAKLTGAEAHYLPPYRKARTLQLASLLGRTPAEIDGGHSPAMSAAVAAQRNIKSAAEVAEVERAVAVTTGMYEAALTTLRPGVRESDVAAAMQRVALSHESAQSFLPIVSVRGEVLHNQSYANRCEAGRLMVADSGAESPMRYASDVTRTLPVSGTYTAKQRAVYEVVLAAQKATIEKSAPGTTNQELHLLAAAVICDGLTEIGLMRGDREAAVAAGAHALFFPHGLGHMLGLDVHDMEDLGDVVGYGPGEKRSEQFGLAYLRMARALEPGFVFTIEPGIYFIPALIDMWESAGKHAEFIDYAKVKEYRDFGGIRIEDDILITENGHRVLTAAIPKEVVDIEKAMA